MSICTSIGHDIIYEHPKCDGAKIGEASYIDFLNLAETLEGIKDAVFICVGSSVTVPMVIEKAYAMAKNVSKETLVLIVVVILWIYLIMKALGIGASQTIAM